MDIMKAISRTKITLETPCEFYVLRISEQRPADEYRSYFKCFDKRGARRFGELHLAERFDSLSAADVRRKEIIKHFEEKFRSTNHNFDLDVLKVSFKVEDVK